MLSAETLMLQERWRKIVRRWEQKEIGGLPAYCMPMSVEDDKLTLGVPPGFWSLDEAEHVLLLGLTRLKTQVKEVCGREYRLTFIERTDCVSADMLDRLPSVLSLSDRLKETFSTTVYQYLVVHRAWYEQHGESKPEYSTIPSFATYGLGDLSFGEELICGNLPLEVLDSVEAQHGKVIEVCLSYPEAARIKALEKPLVDVTTRIREQLDIIISRGILPGKCVVCRGHT